ncbi:hypothetical protein N781_07115 [Pontibacillus halophilus JSM 076056 = DSM 19796]|uniref:histidine kinase n=1 Tax=Pontibacillus halophilus JSM 076056 = DSM 19796 TaxID=1385510 RepID=A0A0A5GF29_9BACI|nr:histidine kinase [Pontibacillus halophilus]KGX90589.1 hypothetical protein N781_07115 [Pontibacillus halophilus JSM 076056 = DSM 19796]
MSNQQIKWLILLLPSFVIGLWEYCRHEFLLSVVSMTMGNWLSPFIVFIVTFIVGRRLFRIMENNEEALKETKAKEAVLEERQKISQELHDSISQSLFLLSVQVKQLEGSAEQKKKIDQTIECIQQEVRYSIRTLRTPPPQTIDLKEALHSFAKQIEEESATIQVNVQWEIAPTELSEEEQLHLYTMIREGMVNCQKHAISPTSMKVFGKSTFDGWEVFVTDNGEAPNTLGTTPDNHFGLRFIHEQAARHGWDVSLSRLYEETVLRITKDESYDRANARLNR